MSAPRSTVLTEQELDGFSRRKLRLRACPAVIFGRSTHPSGGSRLLLRGIYRCTGHLTATEADATSLGLTVGVQYLRMNKIPSTPASERPPVTLAAPPAVYADVLDVIELGDTLDS